MSNEPLRYEEIRTSLQRAAAVQPIVIKEDRWTAEKTGRQ